MVAEFRHLLNYFFTVLILILLLCACADNAGNGEDEPAPSRPAVDSVQLPDGAPEILYAAAEGGHVTVRFISSGEWKASVPDSRQIGNGHFSAYQGAAGLNEITYTALANTTQSARTTTLVVTCGKASLEISVEQPSIQIELPDEEEVRQFLIRLYNETDGPNWRFRERWCSDLPINQWGSSVKYSGGKLELWLTENYLKGHFDMSGCKALTFVKLTKNELTSINLSGCPLLTYAELTSNKLTKVDVTDCPSLRQLHVGYNPLPEIDLSGHYAMAELRVESCRLTTLDLTDCTVLEELSAYENSLTELKLPPVRSRLTSLWCYGNRLRSLDLTGCSQLSLLNCGQNELTSLVLTGCSRLSRLYCYENNLAEIDVTAQRHVLGQFYCYSNRLESLDVRGFKKLSQLHCSDNRLTSLDLTGNPDTRWVLCSFNNISELQIDPAVNMLNILDITSNNIRSVDFTPFGNSIAFCELYCKANPIFSEIPDRVATMDVFEHDARFEYLPDGRYIDYGVGWWYAGEPQSGRHEPLDGQP